MDNYNYNYPCYIKNATYIAIIKIIIQYELYMHYLLTIKYSQKENQTFELLSPDYTIINDNFVYKTIDGGHIIIHNQRIHPVYVECFEGELKYTSKNNYRTVGVIKYEKNEE